jgi:N-glycosylase/DNA lyase
MSDRACHTVLSVRDYDLAATLSSGQAFRWEQRESSWDGVVDRRWVRLCSTSDQILAQTSTPVEDWCWLTDYLRTDEDLDPVLSSFPDDEPLRAAVNAYRGLRLLRQDPWECLASFILSSTKQIVQIRQIVALLCQRFGEPVIVPCGTGDLFSFPRPERIASCTEAELRECKMGFRAPYLRGTAQRIAENEVDLNCIGTMPVDVARAELMRLPGVGKKIADCVLLFAYGFQEAFPVDVWVMKALRQLYFPRRRVSRKRLEKFTATYFGPNAGYAQQYLFHYMRTQAKPKSNPGRDT